MPHRYGSKIGGNGNFGLCVGGPYDGRPIVHHQECMLLGLEQTWRGHYSPIPGATLEIAVDPAITFGAYAWDDDTSRWQWHYPVAVAIRSAGKTL